MWRILTHSWHHFTCLLRGDSFSELARGWSCSALTDLCPFPTLFPCSPGVLLKVRLDYVRGGQEEDCLCQDPGHWTLGCAALTVGGGRGKEVAGVSVWVQSPSASLPHSLGAERHQSHGKGAADRKDSQVGLQSVSMTHRHTGKHLH